MDDQVTSQLPGAASSISPTGDGAGPAPRPASSQAEWPAKVADTIEDVVGAVHDKVIRPLMLVARGVVFGIVVAAMALVLGVLVSVAVVRLLTVYAFSGRVWASDALVGALFVVVGALAWSRRRAGDSAGEA